MFRVRARGGWARATRGFCSARSTARGSFAAQTSATAARVPKDPRARFFPAPAGGRYRAARARKISYYSAALVYSH
jgi:hypothetical protein